MTEVAKKIETSTIIQMVYQLISLSNVFNKGPVCNVLHFTISSQITIELEPDVFINGVLK